MLVVAIASRRVLKMHDGSLESWRSSMLELSSLGRMSSFSTTAIALQREGL